MKLKKRSILWSMSLIVILISCSLIWAERRFLRPTNTAATDEEVAQWAKLPDQFQMTIFAKEVPGARFMTIGPDGHLYLSQPRAGQVVRLIDANKDGKADQIIPVVTGLDRPHGLAFRDGTLYVAGTQKIWRIDQLADGGRAAKVTTLVNNLPDDGGHSTRTILFGKDGKLYVSVGSSCNICEERDPRRAAIARYNPDGTGEEIFAKGLRNSVGIAFHPESGELWGTDNGRDWLGDNVPPEEINIIKQGKHYGWPHCHAGTISDPEFGAIKSCRDTEPPAITFQAHSAPLGLAFYTGNQFPPEYRGDLFVAYHGSWNRNERTGYKVVRVRIKDGKPEKIEDFITGFLRFPGGQEHVWGRPVDLVVAPDGSLFLSDDFAGVVYRITYKKSL